MADYEFLTTEEVPGYIAAHPALAARVDTDRIASVEEIGDGNLNLVFIVEGEWNELYLDELCIFPSGKLMDQVDASSGAFTRLLNIKGAMVISDDVLRRAAQPGNR